MSKLEKAYEEFEAWSNAHFPPSPNARQVGGDHYLAMPIQPLDFSMANNLDACQHSIMKYITRRKGGKEKRLEDIDKAAHVLEFYKKWIIENES